MSVNCMRTCIGCRTQKSKPFLRRLVIDDEGLLVFDEKQRLPGRGGYVCFNDRCMTLALKRRDISSIFKKSVKGINSRNICAPEEVMAACRK